MPLEKWFENDSVRIGHCEQLVVVSFRDWATRDAIEALEALQGRLVERHGPIAVMSVMGAGAFRPDDETRRIAVDLAQRWEFAVSASAIVLRTTGLGGVGVRTFFSGFFLLSRSSIPTQVFGTIATGLQWLEAQRGEPSLLSTVTVADIEAFVHR